MIGDDEFNELNKGIGVGIYLLVIGVVAVVLVSGFFLITGREFGKYSEETRTQVMEENRTYNEGMAQNLDKLCLEWDREGNAAIAQSIRHRSSGYKGELPPHVQQCVDAARKVK